MLFFPSQKKEWPAQAQFVVMIGGSGILGKLLLHEKPEHVVFLNVSRRALPSTPTCLSLYADMATVDPERLIRDILGMIPRIDTCVYGAYLSHFTPIVKLTKKQLLREYSVMIEAPMLIFQKLLLHAIDHQNEISLKKVIAIGSGVYKGTPKERRDLASYAIYKAGLHQMMHAFSYEFEKLRIGTAIIHPGSLREPGIAKNTSQVFWDEALNTAYKKPFTVHDIF